MAEQTTSRFGVTATDLACYDWQAVIASSEDKQCYHYYEKLFKKSAELEKEGDRVGQHVFALLGTVCSFHANYDSTGNPYQPLWRSGDQRALMAEDLSEIDLQTLSEVLPTIQDAELRARIADILWECTKDHKAARIAVTAFIESAMQLEGGEFWSPSVERLERALQVSAKIGFEKEPYTTTVKVVEDVVARALKDISSGLKSARLMDILLSFRAGNPNRYSKAAEHFAEQLAATGQWNFAEEYWWVASRWHRRAKREEEALRCEIEAAETMVKRAEANLAGPTPSYMFAAHWLGRAFEIMRGARAPRTRTEALHVRLLEVQAHSTTELKTLEVNYDDIPGLKEKIEKAADEARRQVKGQTFEDALFKLAFIAHPTNVRELRQRVRAHAKEFALSAIMPGSAMTRTGKIADEAPALGLGTKEEMEKAEAKNMFLQARQADWPTRVAARIEPAREQIAMEHPIRLADFRWLIMHNAFIPPGHAGIYARGFQAGFFGDWLVANHLLIPQLEASVRAVFQQRQIPTSSMQNGIQQEHDLGWLLNHPKATEIFGDGIIFDLRGLLTEDFGWNLRNDVAHGLIAENGFYSEASCLVWWLALRLCCIGQASAMRHLEADNREREN